MKKLSVYMGGTCGDSDWREELKRIDGFDWFDPIVPVWNEEAYKTEVEHRMNDDIILYVITPKMKGVYSIAEVIDDSNKRPSKVVFSFLEEDGDAKFEGHMLKSIEAVARMVQINEAAYVPHNELAAWFMRKLCDSKIA